MRERLIGLFDKQFCVGSIPTGGTKFYTFIAQLVEYLSYKEEVIGSSPIEGTIFINNGLLV